MMDLIIKYIILVNKSINNSLSRTIITSLTTFFVVYVLLCPGETGNYDWRSLAPVGAPEDTNEEGLHHGNQSALPAPRSARNREGPQGSTHAFKDRRLPSQPETPRRARAAAPNIPRPFSKKPSAPPPRSANKRDPHWAQKMRT